MAPLRKKADMIIDTTELKISQLRTTIESEINAASAKELLVSVMSFAYREGLPREADLVFDVRFLRNPYYDPDLRALTGKHPLIGAYIEQDEDYASFFKRLTDFLQPLFPRFQQEGKTRLKRFTNLVSCHHFLSVFLSFFTLYYSLIANWIKSNRKNNYDWFAFSFSQTFGRRNEGRYGTCCRPAGSRRNRQHFSVG